MKKLILIIILLSYSSAFARPVSYPGGWTVILNQDDERISSLVHYTIDAKHSVGLRNEYWDEKQLQLHALQVNYLIKRYNMPSSQANFYLTGGAGYARSDLGNFDGKEGLGAFTGFSADWETRRYFTMYENRLTYADRIDKFYTQDAMIGIAPYIGDYGDLHTWLMLHAEHIPENKDPVIITPMVRLFKGMNLFELGVSEKGDVLTNFTHRF